MRQQPTILHIVGDSAFGGASVLVSSLASYANAHNFDATVLTNNAEFASYLSTAGVAHITNDVVRRAVRPIWDIGGFIRLWRLLKRGDWDIVHTHTSKAGLIGRLAARLAGVRVIVHTVHGFAFHEGSSSASLRLLVLLERIAARSGDVVVTVSEYHRDQALQRKIGTASSVIAIPNGVDTSRTCSREERAVSRRRYGIDDEDTMIVAIGRLAHQKGIDTLVKAIPRVTENHPSVRLVIVGDGPDRPLVNDLIQELQLGSVVTMVGHIDDISTVYNACDLVAIPSRYEGMSITLLESMAAGKPIVATAVPSTREVTVDGNGAFLVPVDDSGGLADGLNQMIDDEAMRVDKGKNAVSIQQERYTEAAMLEAYISLYRRLLARAAQP